MRGLLLLGADALQRCGIFGSAGGTIHLPEQDLFQRHFSSQHEGRVQRSLRVEGAARTSERNDAGEHSGALEGRGIARVQLPSGSRAQHCKGDLIYLDPPYPPLNGTAYFTHYTASRFGDSDHEKVAAICKELDRGKCLLLVSNADTPKIRQLYRQFNCNSVEVTRFVTCKSKHMARELITANYEIPRTELNI